MGTQGAGRKRTPLKDRFSAEDEALSSIAREAEARLAAKRAARAEARDIRMKELERQQKEPSSRCATPALSAAALATLGGTSSRRGSTDTSSVYDPDTSLGELRLDFRLCYASRLQELDKESPVLLLAPFSLINPLAPAGFLFSSGFSCFYLSVFSYLFCSLSSSSSCPVPPCRRSLPLQEGQRMQTKLDALTREAFDLQETINWKDKKIALERQKEYFDCIRNERDELRDELADIKGKSKKHGLVIIPEDMPNGDVNHEPLTSGFTVVTQEAAQVLESAGEGALDVRLRKLAEEKDELLAQIRKLKNQLEEEKQKHSKLDGAFTDGEGLENGTDLHLIEMQRDANRQISEYKFKLSKAEQEMGTMEQNITRLEGQVARYKAAADNSEKIEDELKAEKRRLQRELRTALDKIEEMEMTNSHLVKRLEKMKANRNALLSQQ
uniref:Leucine-rich repeat flightless-interacting protein 2 n=1 Tax=Fundulus heteroclitus TaxID=8078 RepID=A0A3Q2QZB5_FUNHE